MKRTSSLIVVLLCLLLAAPMLKSEPPRPKGEQERLEESLQTLQDLYLKKVTLLWLADARSEEKLTTILSTFDASMQRNFMANIKGDYQAVIIQNFDSVIASHEKNLLEWGSAKDFQNSEVLVEMVSALEPAPFRDAFSKVFLDIKTRLDFKVLQEKTEDLTRLKGILDSAIVAIADVRSSAYDLGEAVFGHRETDDVPIWWFDDRQYEIFNARPIENIDSHAQIDLNSADKASLAQIPGLDEVLAAAIEKYRIDYNGFNGLEELRRVEGIDDSVYSAVAPLLKVVPVKKPKKKWTIMVWLNADNDLERFGLSDVNEMEIVGSTEDVNIVVQIDRCKGNEGTTQEGNWSGARRYYVMQDNDRGNIKSPLIKEMGESDMGSANELADFGRWCVEYYPADRYVLTIWNHGAGWQGISYDHQSYYHLSVPDVMTGVKSIVDRMRELQPEKKRLDIVDFDACLMALLEVGYEIEPGVEIMLASQLEEPGQGMPYDDYLAPLATNPDMSTEDFAKVMVEKFILSYIKEGSQNPGYFADITTSTKSAVRTSQLKELVHSVDQLAKHMLADFNLYSKLREANSRSLQLIRAFKSNRENYDLYHLVAALQSAKGVPNTVKDICQNIRTHMGWRFNGLDPIDRAKIVRSKEPGFVLWGINGWQLPPDELFGPTGQLYHSRYVRTPLEGPDDNGWYRAALTPFTQIVAIEKGRKKRKLIETIDYQIVSKDGKKGERRSVNRSRTKEYRIETQFPKSSPLIAEGHTQGMANAHGICIYFPYPLDFARPYQELRFSKETSWDELISRVPQYEGYADGLLVGPVLKGRAPAAPTFDKAVATVGMTLEQLREPAIFGYDFPKIFDQYRSGFVIVSGVDQNSYGSKNLAPSANEVLNFVKSGGKVILFSRKEQELNLFTPFYREIGSEFAASEQRELELQLPDGTMTTTGLKDGWKYFFGSISMKPYDGAESFLTTTDGKCLGTYKNLGDGAIVYIGTRFSCIDSPESRASLLKAAIKKLGVR